MEVTLTNRELPADLLNALLKAGSLAVTALWADVGSRRYSVLISRDPINAAHEPRDLRWHISTAGETTVAPWEHMVAIAHAIRPGVCFVVGVPPKSWWINVHPHCLHLWELKDANLLGQWRFESRGDTPT